MNGFGFGTCNCYLWILILILLLCCNGCNIIDGICGLLDNCCLPIVLALLFCFCCKGKNGCGGNFFGNCK